MSDTKNRTLLRITILVFSVITFFSSNLFCYEQHSDILLGFIDNGSWHRKGDILLEIKIIGIDINQIILKKQYIKARKKDYIEISYADLKDHVSIKHDQIYEIYSKYGYHGQYKLENFVALNNACSEEYFLFIKLNGQIITNGLSENYIIARELNKKNQNKFQIINSIILTKDEDIQIQDALTKKFEFALNNLLAPEMKALVLKNENKLKFTTNSKVFRIKKNENKNYIVVNTIWHCEDELLVSDTGYFITNTFILSDNNIIDILPIGISFDEKLNIPRIEYGIDFGDGNGIKWLVRYEKWERGYISLMEFESNKQRIILQGIEFGC